MLVLVAGLPGSGKSFFSERLSSRMNAVYISSDKVRMALQALGKYSPEDKLVVYHEMIRLAATAIEAKRDVVVDATFYHHTYRDLFIQLAHGYNMAIQFIEIVADERLIKQRLLKPRQYSEADFHVYEQVRDEFEEIRVPHLLLESKSSNIDAMLTEAEKYLCIGKA